MIITLGEILVDRIADDIGNDISLIQSWTDFSGGAPANVACALRRLGTNCAFLGAIGNDDVGDRLLSTLASYDVNLDWVQRCSAPTRQVYVTRNETGDRTFAGFGDLHSSMFADTQLHYCSPVLMSSLNVSFLYIGSLILAQPSAREAVDQYLAFAHRHDIPCFMDVNWRPMFWNEVDEAKQVILDRLCFIRFIKLSEEEALWLFKTQSPQHICDRLPHLQGVFITKGAKGCDYQLYDFCGTMPGFTVKALDTTGAGDAFVAGCLHQLVGETDVQTAKQAKNFVRYANAVGALTTLQLGAIAPSPTAHDVMKFLVSKCS